MERLECCRVPKHDNATSEICVPAKAVQMAEVTVAVGTDTDTNTTTRRSEAG